MVRVDSLDLFLILGRSIQSFTIKYNLSCGVFTDGLDWIVCFLSWKGVGILVWAAVTSYHRPGGSDNIYFSKFQRRGSPREGCQHGWITVRDPFLVCRWLSSCAFIQQREEKKQALLIRALISFMSIAPS